MKRLPAVSQSRIGVRAADMDGRPPPGLKTVQLTVLLTVLLYTNAGRPHGSQITGLDHGLHCVNDYLFTVSCTLSITADDNSSYWLTFTETYFLTKYVCKLTKTRNSHFCSFQTPKDSDTFTDSDAFNISLCHHGEEGEEGEEGPDGCELLDDDYRPVENIQPNPPCCLAVVHNASQYHFAWNSTYEEYGPYTGLTDDLQYQLLVRRTGDQVILHRINSDETRFSMEAEVLEEGEDYSARVRSRPGRGHYGGQWSHWSPGFQWRAEEVEAPSGDLPRNKFLSEPEVVVVSCAAVLLLLLLCCVPVHKWRRSVLIPTPAPYFDTLYGDCRGDFKSWLAAQERPAELLNVEETLRIDTVTKCEEEEEEEEEEERSYQRPWQLTEGDHSYGNVSAPGLPYAGGGGEEPGRRLYSNTLAEDEPPWYCNQTCNEYCTLSSLPPPAGRHGGS